MTGSPKVITMGLVQGIVKGIAWVPLHKEVNKCNKKIYSEERREDFTEPSFFSPDLMIRDMYKQEKTNDE